MTAPIKPFNNFKNPPLGLLSLASEIRDKHKVKILDLAMKDTSKNKLRKFISWSDVIGISSNWTMNKKNTIELAKWIKSVSPSIRIISGGNHATFDYESYLDNGFDYIVMYEAERTFVDLINQLNSEDKNVKKVKGIAFKQNNEIIVTEPRHFIKNLDNLKIPSWDLIDPSLYNTFQGRYYNMETSRGCIHKCIFCSDVAFWKNTWRSKSTKRVVHEMLLLKDQGAEFIRLIDANFGVDTERVIEICNLLKKKRYDLPWSVSLTANSIVQDPKMVRALCEANCQIISIGFESGSDKILKKLNKPNTVEINRKAIEIIKKSNIILHGAFMFGYPDESIKEIKKTIALSKEVNLSSYSILRPYLGTSMQPLIKKDSFDDYNQGKSFIHPHSKFIEKQLIKSYMGSLFNLNTLKKVLFSDRKSPGFRDFWLECIRFYTLVLFGKYKRKWSSICK